MHSLNITSKFKLVIIILIASTIYFISYIYKKNYHDIDLKSDQIKFRSIKVDSAYKYYLNQTTYIIDARRVNFYEYEKIKGAFSYPIDDYERWKSSINKIIPKESTIVVYCDSKFCGISYQECILLTKLGYKNVYNLIGGIDAWIEAGYPIETSL